MIAPQIVKSVDYEAVRNDKYMEARLYAPRKRTIQVNGCYYFLQFPQVLGVKVILERKPTNYWHVAPTAGYSARDWYSDRPCSFLNFAFVNDGLVYPSYIYQVDYVADKLGVCLVDNSYHAWWPSNTSLSEMMRIFWTTEFSSDGRCPHFKSYENWQRLNLNEVVEAISLSPSVTLDAHFLKLEEVCRSIPKAFEEEALADKLKAQRRAEELRVRAELNKVEEARKAKVIEALAQAWAQRKVLKKELL